MLASFRETCYTVCMSNQLCAFVILKMQVSEQEMPEIDQKSFDGVNAQLERDQKSQSIDPAASVSSEVEAPLLSYICYTKNLG